MTQIKSTMAGTVFTVNVAVGEEVAAGQIVAMFSNQ